MFPAARLTDPITHDLLVPCGIIGPPITGPCQEPPVIIEMFPAAHVLCTVLCTGVISVGLAHPPPPPGTPPPPIVKGSLTVFIHGLPAARWAPAPDFGACGVFLGDPKLAASRTVFIGDIGMAFPPTGAGPQAPGAGADLVKPTPVEKPPGDLKGPLKEARDEKKEKTWIGIYLKDFNGQPIAGQDFQATLQGGQVLSGRTDENGYRRFDGLDPDQGEVEFVNIPDDQEAEVESGSAESAFRLKTTTAPTDPDLPEASGEPETGPDFELPFDLDKT